MGEPDWTTRKYGVTILNDLDTRRQYTRATRQAIGVRQQQRWGASAPTTGAIVGFLRPQGAMAVEHDDQRYVEQGIVLEPNTRVRYAGPDTLNPATGRSSVVVQMDERSQESLDPTQARGSGGSGGSGAIKARKIRIFGPNGQVISEVGVETGVDLGPTSNQWRVVAGHLCLIGNDPQEHSPRDPAHMVGGGFLAWKSHQPAGGFIRTRIGDPLAPMKHGIPSFPDVTRRMTPQQGVETPDESTTQAREPGSDFENPAARAAQKAARAAIDKIQGFLDGIGDFFFGDDNDLDRPVNPDGGFAD